jgi:hypothetical protein
MSGICIFAVNVSEILHLLDHGKFVLLRGRPHITSSNEGGGGHAADDV